MIFYILSALCFVGGAFLSFRLLPGDPEYGYEWKTIAYLSSIIAFVSGFVQAALFSAIGKGVYYLDKIAKNTRRLDMLR